MSFSVTVEHNGRESFVRWRCRNRKAFVCAVIAASDSALVCTDVNRRSE